MILVDFYSLGLADFLLPGSGSGWRKWNGSKRIRIRNTGFSLFCDLLGRIVDEIENKKSNHFKITPPFIARYDRIFNFWATLMYNVHTRTVYVSGRSMFSGGFGLDAVNIQSAPYWLYNVRLISGLEHYYSLGTQYDGLVSNL